MTGTEWSASFRRRMGNVSTNVLSAANLLVIANESKNDLAEKIVERNSQYFTAPVLFDLVASDVAAREYAWPDDILSRLVTVEADFEVGNSPLKYIPLKPYPGGMERLVDDVGGITEANIIANFSNDDANQTNNGGAYYVLTRRGIYILSAAIVAVTNGGKIRYRAYPADLANLAGSTGLHLDPTTTTFGIPLQFHNLWVDLACIKYKTERPNPLPLSEWDNAYPARLEDALRSIGKDDQREEMFGSLPSYNNGLDC